MVVVFFAAATGARDDAVKEEMKKLEGTWKTESSIRDGKKLEDEKAKAYILKLKADGTWSMTNGKDTWTGTFTVDPTKKPKTGHFIGKTGPFKDKSTLDIYELDGDKLTFCYVVVPTAEEATKTAPTKFVSETGSGYSLDVLKREKPSEKK
jgi:uncharacterized protein (TIGR03067 family)